MENAADALKMAGAVLIFVLAISIIILAFGQVRETADTILDYKDRETSYIDYYNNDTTSTVRTVNLETIIPSIFRAYLEEYQIVFVGLKDPIYSIVEQNGTRTKKYTINLSTETLGSEQKKAEFLCGILYHDFTNINATVGTPEEFFKTKNFGIKIDLPTKSLYRQLDEANKITEYLGVYYLNDAENTPEIMKQEKRIITYVVE